MTAVDPRHVVVTGCSSGFGPRIVRQAQARGWQVHATVRDVTQPGEMGGILAATATVVGPQPTLTALDLTDSASVNAAAHAILERSAGRLDAVVHNAGIADAGFVEDQPDAALRRVMETNFFGVAALTRALLPALRGGERGRIVVISSVSAFTASPALSAYVASKRAVEGWAECLALEVRPFGVDVVLVEPASYRTAIWDKARIARSGTSPYAGFVDHYEAKVRALIERAAGDPDDVAVKVADVLDRRRVSLRQPVGRDAHLGRIISRVVPFSWRAAAIARWAGLTR